ncbi:MAG: hypothetical protein ABL925_16940, partial [Methylococcales bacterium]
MHHIRGFDLVQYAPLLAPYADYHVERIFQYGRKIMAFKLTTHLFPGFTTLFALDIPILRGTFIGEFAEHDWAGHDNEELFRGETEVKSPLRVNWLEGASPAKDIVKVMMFDLLISEKVVKLLTEHKITGWRTYPVNLYDRAGAYVPGYQGLSVFGRCGGPDPAKTVRGLREFPTGMKPVYRGFYFDPDSWDGSDLFCPHDSTAHIFASEKVKTIFKKNKVSGAALDENLVFKEWNGLTQSHPALVKQINKGFVQDWTPQLQEFSERMQSQGLPCVLHVYP